MTATPQQAKDRFSDAAFSRAGRYQEGAQGKGSKWNAAKGRAKTNFVPAMQEALQKDAYGKGLDRAQASDYDNGIQDKGVNNWPVGMQAGADKYAARVQKFTTLWSESLPTAPGNRRSASNIKRMTENVQRFITAAGK
ncbi:hypothetical protein L0Y40_01265 [Candidatus Wolfebacteria bacterium]|nr:hypothetical protein [Candidatus Wolfebacteria bacterium]